MIKILWFSNIVLSTDSMSGTGTWISAMADSLIKNTNIELYCITKGDVSEVINKNYKSIKQWVLPNVKVNRNGLPPRNFIDQIQKICDSIQPDIIHVWGTEYYWSKLTADDYIKGTVLLEMQGLISAIADKVLADLTCYEIIGCIGLKEIIKPSTSIIGGRKKFKKRGAIENEIISKHNFISTQSEWMRSYISYLNPNARVFKTLIGLRQEFVKSKKWSYDNCTKNRILMVTSTNSAYKGLHTIIKAFDLLIKTNKHVELHICGPLPIEGIRQPGYERFLMKIIKQNNLEEKVFWLGPLNTKELINQMLDAHVVVNPSFIESYSLVLKEALLLGIPTVVSYAGAMPEHAVHNNSAIYFPAGDVVLCYKAIDNIISNPMLSKKLSDNATSLKIESNIGDIQISIYKEIINTLADK